MTEPQPRIPTPDEVLQPLTQPEPDPDAVIPSADLGPVAGRAAGTAAPGDDD